jgi:hypothetical protein
MNKRQMLLTAVLSSIFSLTVIAGVVLLLTPARAAAPPANTQTTPISQTTITPTLQYISVSALDFNPAQSDTAYNKDTKLQLLSLTSQTHTNSNLFVAPLSLRDRSELLGMTVYGEDADNLGEVRMSLKRCNHGQPFCVILAETTSTTPYALGPFETSKTSVLNEIIDNQFYSYFLELDLTALGNSGLRSVRLEIIPREAVLPPPQVMPWALEGSVRSFKLPNTKSTQVKICTDDLSHLNNTTHYPYVVVDSNQIYPLSSNMCETIWGGDIEIRRDLNTGSSSGTYQFLREAN